MTRRLKNATFVAWLKSCAKKKDLYNGERLHRDILERKLLENSPYLASSLIDMYTKCGEITKAQKVLEELNVREVVSWNALITGYVQQGQGHQALESFERMRSEGISADAITFTCVVKACGNIGTIEKGKQIHDEIVSRGLLEKDIVLGNALIDMYAKCQMLSNACKVLQELPCRNVVTWSTLIAGHAQQGHGQEALNCFEKMQHDNVSPDLATVVSCLKACSQLGASEKGQEIHAAITSEGLEKDVFIGSALIDMYCNCGILSRAQEVFDNHVIRDSVTWNALLAGYAQLGESDKVFSILNGMLEEGQRPSMVTFVSVLNACSHAGLLERGPMFFDAIDNNYDLIPNLKHCTCIVDLLGRAGLIDKAAEFINNMPLHPDIAVWLILLGACRKWNNVDLGRYAFEHAVQLSESDSTAYVCMSNIYMNASTQEAQPEKVGLFKAFHTWMQNTQTDEVLGWD